MRRGNIPKFIFCLFILLTLACERDNGPKGFNVEIEVSSIICYPNDNITLTFRLNSSNGQAPYRYEWLNPDSLIGEGPFKINLTDDLFLEVNVTDSINNKVYFTHQILRDTIDSLKYDYRNSFLGLYRCDVTACSVNTDTWVRTCNSYIDTIEVTVGMGDPDLANQFIFLKISNIPEVEFNIADSSFQGYHTNGRFFADSIYCYYFATPVALYSWEYTGKKLNH